MSFWSYANLADVTNGRWLVAPEDANAEVTGLWHDTRDLQQGQAYLAIQGDNFDGHDFVDKAFDAGAALAIISAQPPSLEGGAGGRVPTQPVLQVDDTVKALQDFARAYRDELASGGCKVIGIAGSNGKTTTRHLIHHVLTHAGLSGTQSPKSFNNHLGVPLTLLSARPGDDFVACEIGTNHPGEIDFLSAIARPDIAVITSIGEEHLEFFGDLEGVADEEAAIVSHLVPGGTLVIQHVCYSEYKQFHYGGQVIRTGGEAALNTQLTDHIPESDLYYAIREMPARAARHGSPFDQHATLHFDNKTKDICLNLPGRFNLDNACTALGVARVMGPSIGHAAESLSTFSASPMRGEVQRFGSNLALFNDAYNANPSSMTAALITLVWTDTPGRRVAVLGDMFELGQRSKDLHRRVAEDMDWHFMERATLDLVVLCGIDTQEMADVFRWKTANVICFPEFTDQTPCDVAALLQPGDTVLLKASRGMRLERLIPAIERRFGPRQAE